MTHGGSSETIPPVELRLAAEDDLPAIVALLADDPLGASRESSDAKVSDAYRAAFATISADDNHLLLVAESKDEVVGVLQLSFLPHLTYEGGWRAQIEGVRVAARLRSLGVGRAMFEEAIERARARGCHLVQLTTDRRRPDALAFYERLGFVASHDGLKLHLGET
ncbi:MAG: GNAT family N-acetyltransferase [Gemmatimonadetes bacterium]|nr:GNAT family N-acetyltransferase [Gemmatimonadota bacterium]